MSDEFEDYGMDNYDEEDFGFRVNMTEEEASTEPRDFTPLPSGKYLVAITDAKVKKVTNPPKPNKTDNRGKPYFAFEFTVQDGQYAGRKAWTNAMLFDGALYTVVPMLKALGVEFNDTDFQVEGFEKNVIPKGDWWIGQQMVTYIKLTKGGKKEDGSNYDDRGEPKAFWPADTWEGATSSEKGSNSLLPD